MSLDLDLYRVNNIMKHNSDQEMFRSVAPYY